MFTRKTKNATKNNREACKRIEKAALSRTGNQADYEVFVLRYFFTK